jgi:hypothetical protein
MSDLTWSINAQVQKGALNQTFVASGVTANCNASGINTQTLTPGTDAAGTAAISTASMSSIGLFFARNLSTVSTAAVSFGQLAAGTMVPCVSLQGGEAAVGRLSPGSYAAQSNQAGTQLLITIIEG